MLTVGVAFFFFFPNPSFSLFLRSTLAKQVHRVVGLFLSQIFAPGHHRCTLIVFSLGPFFLNIARCFGRAASPFSVLSRFVAPTAPSAFALLGFTFES